MRNIISEAPYAKYYSAMGSKEWDDHKCRLLWLVQQQHIYVHESCPLPSAQKPARTQTAILEPDDCFIEIHSQVHCYHSDETCVLRQGYRKATQYKIELDLGPVQYSHSCILCSSMTWTAMKLLVILQAFGFPGLPHKNHSETW